MIVIFSALKQEVVGLKEGMRASSAFGASDRNIYEGKCGHKNSVLVLTGIGKERAQKVANLTLEKYPISLIISTGCGGALNERTRPGDIVIYSKLSCSSQPEPKAIFPDSNLILVASGMIQEFGFKILAGNGVSVDRVCATPESKRNLGRESGADIVDMESYWIGRIAAEKGLPFITIRSVFDSVQDDLSLLGHIMANGKLKFPGAMGHFIAHPGKIKKAVEYSLKANQAQKNLSLFLDQFLDKISELD